MQYFIGKKIEITKYIDKEVVQKFAQVSGDFNPIHLDEDYASKSQFGKCIAHGMIGASFISAVIGMEFPGEGTIYLKQNLKFLKPIYIGQNIEVEIEIIELMAKNRAKLRTDIRNQNGEKVIEGQAVVILPNNTEKAR